MPEATRNRMSREPEYLQLMRRQLDARTQRIPAVDPPARGWIHAVRTALGMSARQLAGRLGVTPSAVAQLERNERTRRISLDSLAKAADALDCDVEVTFRPRTSVEAFMRRQAADKARAERDRTMHTMRLEGQDDGVAQTLDLDESVRRWMTARAAALWD
jgi:predicted DNA-binding mobile mystery protein A